ncbi:hypothetical protein CBR_g6344 [Chara braunii]|uniref:Uncharacterized protein n=1 Tax=Chara braunii TaxID=69332 RepID=A0A388KJI1_CHABU|nr:hypothetical protein CBR_g6344 [Chara braunii]|eukprot:GBG70212.1 hypothetical protein CBR_g6344 [Chara braunii]
MVLRGVEHACEVRGKCALDGSLSSRVMNGTLKKAGASFEHGVDVEMFSMAQLVEAKALLGSLDNFLICNMEEKLLLMDKIEERFDWGESSKQKQDLDGHPDIIRVVGNLHEVEAVKLNRVVASMLGIEDQKVLLYLFLDGKRKFELGERHSSYKPLMKGVDIFQNLVMLMNSGEESLDCHKSPQLLESEIGAMKEDVMLMKSGEESLDCHKSPQLLESEIGAMKEDVLSSTLFIEAHLVRFQGSDLRMLSQGEMHRYVRVWDRIRAEEIKDRVTSARSGKSKDRRRQICKCACPYEAYTCCRGIEVEDDRTESVPRCAPKMRSGFWPCRADPEPLSR